MEEISFDEFKRMDLRVAEILKAERVEGTNKLIKLEVNIGDENRQMVAGIADTYSPEDLLEEAKRNVKKAKKNLENVILNESK